jgi:hypothetical protein
MTRIGRSFSLVGQSYRILMQDKELMVLPLLSGICIVAVSASFFFGFGLSAAQFETRNPGLYVPVFLAYVVTYAIGIFFQAAVIAGATERLRGGDPTVGSALSAAARRIGPILMWALVAATVGTLLRALRDRAGFVGRIAAAIAGAAWSLATLFVVPVLVLEDRSVMDSFKRSVSVFKETWGETFVGNVSLGAAALVSWMTLVAVTGMLGWAGAGIIFTLAVFFSGAVFLVTLFSALQGVFVASLYRYATEGHTTSGFNGDLLATAFVGKPSR